ncbi:MAG: tRNA (cytidine(34)-2'-O)-methyltransferase [Promicromonosporaceae bacterium]|nr:tRNA (cytidine(34)-2'-O)-methyltransferase [Promicromonosporaceae bacterium]
MNPHLTAPPPAAQPLLHLVFFEPRIAGNTGSAIRLAAATGARLHLVEPLGFDLSEPKLKRAGLDYHELAVVDVHANLDACLTALPAGRVIAFEVSATMSYADVAYRRGDILLFGPEPTGLTESELSHPRVTHRVRIPMVPGRRSLNLTNSAAVALYEAWRQLGFGGGC